MCIEVCVCTRVQLASWSTAVRWEYVKKRQGGNSSSSLLLQWDSNTRSPAVVLCHFTAERWYNTPRELPTVKLRPAGKPICFACTVLQRDLHWKAFTVCVLWCKMKLQNNQIKQYYCFIHKTVFNSMLEAQHSTCSSISIISSRGNKCWALTVVGLTGSRPSIGHIHQRSSGLWQRLVVDCVGHCGGLLFIGLPKVIVCQQHGRPVICKTEKKTLSIVHILHLDAQVWLWGPYRLSPWCLSPRWGAVLWGCRCAFLAFAAACSLCQGSGCSYWGD